MAGRNLGSAFIVISPETRLFRAQTDEQVRRAITGINPKIRIGADTAAAQATVAAFTAKAKALASQLADMRMNVKDAGSEAAVSKLQAKVEQLARKMSGLTMAADTKKLDAQIVAKLAQLRKLQDGMSHLRLDADAKKLSLKIAQAENQGRRLREQLANLDMDADPHLILAKIDEVDARLALLHAQAEDKNNVLVMSNVAALRNIAVVSAELRALQQQARDTRLGTSVDPAQMTALLNGLLDVEAAAGKLAPSFGPANARVLDLLGEVAGLNRELLDLHARADTAQARAGIGSLQAQGDLLAARLSNLPVNVSDVQLAAAAAKVAAFGKAVSGAGSAGGGKATPVFAGGGWFNLGGSIAGIKAWHIALDSVLEAVIAVTGAAIALAAGIAAIAEPAKNIYTRMQSVRTVSAALGTSIPPLTGKFDALAKSMAPQTIELFGAGLNIINSQSQNLHRELQPVVDLFSTWAAKIAIWVSNQRQFGTVVQKGTGYLAQFGTAVGHLVSAITNLLSKDPGMAHYFLNVIQGFTVLLDLVSKLPKPLLQTALALHGVYLWTKVLAVAPILGFAKALGILSAKQAGAAVDALKFKNIIGALATGNPWAWAGVAAIAIGVLAFRLQQASGYARDFNASLEAGLNIQPASQAIFSISSDIGQLDKQIGLIPDRLNHVQDASNKAWTSAGKDFEKAAGQFTKGNLIGATENWAKTLFGVGKAAVDAGTGVVHFAQTRNDAAAFTAEITRLGKEQGTLVQVMGHFAAGGRTVEQSLALMDLAGVRANDTFSYAVQKVNNLITGYKNVTGTGGALENSVNAVTFSALQQQEKVSQLNSAWDDFIKTITGGESSFLTFAQQTGGLYQVLATGGAKLRESSGKVSSSIAALGTAATGAKGSMTGLDTASINAQQTFIQAATDANATADNLALLANAAGGGQKTVNELNRAQKDMVALLIPAAQHSKALATILYDLALRGGYQGANSLQELSHWAGVAKNPLKDLQGITSDLTVKAGNLTQDIKNLSLALGTTLTSAMSSVIFTFDGGVKTLAAFATAVRNSHGNLSAMVPAATNLADEFLKLTGNVSQSHDQFVVFAGKLGLSRDQAEKLWNMIKGKLNPALGEGASKTLPDIQKAFASWADNGLHYSQGKAIDLWSTIVNKLHPNLDALGNLASGPAKAKFIDWAEHGLHLSQTRAQALWQELVTLQTHINNLHGKTFAIVMQAHGFVTVSDGKQTFNISQGAWNSPHAAGGYIHLGTGPTSDDVPAMLSRGEYVIRASSVAKYGKGTMDAINAGAFAAGGPVRKFAGGGLAGLPDAWPGQAEAVTEAETKSATVKGLVAGLTAGVKDAMKLALATGSGPAVLQYAMSFLHKVPYVWGGSTPSGWDCCLTYNSPMLTVNGPKKIGEARPGDLVWAWEDGKPVVRRVIRRSEPRYQPVFRLRTRHREIEASGNHPFLALRNDRPHQADNDCSVCGQQPAKCRGACRNCYNRYRYQGRLGELAAPNPGYPGRTADDWRAEWVNLEDLRRGDIIVSLKSLPDDGATPEDPWLSDERFCWLLGLAFADGSMSRQRPNRVDLCVFGGLREQVQDRLENYCGRRGTEHGKHGLYLHHAKLAAGLARYGMCRDGQPVKSTERHVPRELWTLPHHLIQAFLDGYAAGDGCIQADKRGNPFIRFTAANEQLIRDIRYLHIILGHGVSNTRQRHRSRPIVIKGKQVGTALPTWYFEARETNRGRLAGSLLSKHGIAKLFPPDSHFAPQQILEIEPLGEKDTYDITVEGAHNFVAEGLVVHNSGMVSYIYDHFKLFSGRIDAAGFQRWAKPSAPTPGGLAFYGNPAHHVGFVVNNTTLLSALGHAFGTTLSSLQMGDNSGYGVPPQGFGSASGALGGGGGSVPKNKLQELAFSMLAQFGWQGQWPDFNALETREAGWRLTATNPGSKAYGLAQFDVPPGGNLAANMAQYYAYGGNPNTAEGQLLAMLNYISHRYPSGPNEAWAHEVSAGWYKHGGPVGMAAGGAVGAYRSKLAAEEAAEKRAYGTVAADIHRKGLARSTRDELGTLSRRQSAEVAAYNAAMRSLTTASAHHLGAEARAELRTAHDKGLAHVPGIGTLISRLNTLNATASHPPGSTSGGGSGPALTPALRAKLTLAEGEVKKAYGTVAADIHRKGLSTSTKNELGTLAKREASEVSAWNAAYHHFTRGNVDHLGATARAELRTAEDKGLAKVPGIAELIYRLKLLDAYTRGASTAGITGPGALPTTTTQKSFSKDPDRAALLAAVRAEIPAAWNLLGSKLPKQATAAQHRDWAAWAKVIGAQQKKTFGLTSGTTGGGDFQQLLSAYTVAGRAPNWPKFSNDLNYMIREVEGTGIKGGINPPGTPRNSGYVPWHYFHTKWGYLLTDLRNIVPLLQKAEASAFWNPGSLGASHTAVSDILKFDTGRGVLPPGLSLTWNGTGRPEPLSSHDARFGSGSPQKITLEVKAGGASEFEQFMLTMIRRFVRVKGGGNTQAAFGRVLASTI